MAEPAIREILQDSEGGYLIRLSGEMDLDQVLLELAQQYGDDIGGWWDDDPTYLPPTYTDGPMVGWFRKTLCTCGDDHAWDWMFVGPEKPEGNKRFGAWLGVYFGG